MEDQGARVGPDRGARVIRVVSSIATLAAFATAMPTNAASDPAPIEKVLAGSGQSPAPGCAAGVFDRHGARIFAAGYADLAARRPIDGETQFYVASVSKQFTALAVAQLVLDGRISLDDDARRWVPELPQYQSPVTIAMLMHHVSGIRDPLALMRLSGQTDYSAPTRADAIAMLVRQKNTNFVPGTRYEYSNGGYLLLSEIVERASGQPFADYVQRHILSPLGMTRSLIFAGVRPTGDNLAHGYVPSVTGFALRDDNPLYGGAGGLLTTVNDFAKYHRDITALHKVWTGPIAAMLERPGTLADGSPATMAEIGAVYASGLMLHAPWIEHGGDAEGFKSNYARLADGSLGIAVFCNRGDVVPTDKADAILALLGKRLPPIVVPPNPPAEANGRFFSDELQTEYRLQTTENRLTITRARVGTFAGPGAPLEMKRLTDGSYGSEDGRTRLTLAADRRGFVLDSWRAQGIRFVRIN